MFNKIWVNNSFKVQVSMSWKRLMYETIVKLVSWIRILTMRVYLVYNLKIDMRLWSHSNSYSEMYYDLICERSRNTNSDAALVWIKIWCIFQQLSMFHIKIYRYSYYEKLKCSELIIMNHESRWWFMIDHQDQKLAF